MVIMVIMVRVLTHVTVLTDTLSISGVFFQVHPMYRNAIRTPGRAMNHAIMDRMAIRAVAGPRHLAVEEVIAARTIYLDTLRHLPTTTFHEQGEDLLAPVALDGLIDGEGYHRYGSHLDSADLYCLYCLYRLGLSLVSEAHYGSYVMR